MSTKLQLLGAGLLAAALALPGSAVPGGDVTPFDPIPMEPVLLYDVSGATFGGPVARSLVVYNNGRVQVSQAGGHLDEPYVFAGQLNQAELQRMLNELDRWKHLKDQKMQVADLPVQTLTRISNGKASSVSWYVGFEGHGHLEAALDGMRFDLFPWLVD